MSISRRRLVLLAVAAATLVVAPAPGRAAPTAGPHLVSDVRAGRDRMTPHPPEQGDTTVEPAIAANPADPNNAVAVYQEGRVNAAGDQANGFATTFDGGRTWTFGELPGLTKDAPKPIAGPWMRASDPVVAFGPGGTVVYACSLVFDIGSDTSPSGVAVNVSTDGGRTWSGPTYPDDQQHNNGDDKEWIAVDQTSGRVYVAWDRSPGGVLLSYSDDQAGTWSAPSAVSTGFGVGAIPLPMPNGDLAVVWEAYGPVGSPGSGPEIQPRAAASSGVNMVVAVATAASSVTGGAPIPFGAPTTIGAYEGNPIRLQRAGALPTAAVDPASGRIYAGWEDGRFRRDRVNDAVVTWSADEGATWHRLKPVDPGPRNDWVDRYNTTIGVGSDGTLRVAYLTRREAPSMRNASPFVHAFYQQSSDGGRTFTAPLRIDRGRRADVRFAAFSRGGAFFGDYETLAVAGSRTYVVTCRSYRLHRGERATFPPSVHHQRTWVSVVGGG